MIEVLVVIGLMVVLMMMTTPAFEKMAVGSGVDGASRMVTAELRLARQYAIARRMYVAVVFPRTEAFSADSCYTGLRACAAETSAGPFAWVPNSNWEFLPAGSIVAEADDDAGTASPPSDTNPVQVNVDTDGDGAADVNNVRAIVFKPTGALAGTTGTVYVTLAEGFYNNPTATIRNDKNTVDVETNPFTGRIRVR
jgi:Tfp pilus assembly protein FimT